MELCVTCGKCCFETEMELSKTDILRIVEQTSMDKLEFAYEVDGMWILKNKGNKCIFLQESAAHKFNCSIYEARPTGCRFYPLIYDILNKKCIFDKDCPSKDEFWKRQLKGAHKKECKALQKWVFQDLLKK